VTQPSQTLIQFMSAEPIFLVRLDIAGRRVPAYWRSPFFDAFTQLREFLRDFKGDHRDTIETWLKSCNAWSDDGKFIGFDANNICVALGSMTDSPWVETFTESGTLPRTILMRYPELAAEWVTELICYLYYKRGSMADLNACFTPGGRCSAWEKVWLRGDSLDTLSLLSKLVRISLHHARTVAYVPEHCRFHEINVVEYLNPEVRLETPEYNMINGHRVLVTDESITDHHAQTHQSEVTFHMEFSDINSATGAFARFVAKLGTSEFKSVIEAKTDGRYCVTVTPQSPAARAYLTVMDVYPAVFRTVLNLPHDVKYKSYILNRGEENDPDNEDGDD